LVLALARVAVPLGIPDPRYALPEDRELSRVSVLPPVSQLVCQRMAELLVADRARRVQSQGVASPEILAQAAGLPAALAHEPEWARRPAEERVERIGVGARGDPAGDRANPRTVVQGREAGIRAPLPRTHRIEPLPPRRDLEERPGATGDEHASRESEHVDPVGPVLVDVRERHCRGPPTAPLGRSHGADDGEGLD